MRSSLVLVAGFYTSALAAPLQPAAPVASVPEVNQVQRVQNGPFPWFSSDDDDENDDTSSSYSNSRSGSGGFLDNLLGGFRNVFTGQGRPGTWSPKGRPVRPSPDYPYSSGNQYSGNRQAGYANPYAAAGWNTNEAYEEFARPQPVVPAAQPRPQTPQLPALIPFAQTSAAPVQPAPVAASPRPLPVALPAPVPAPAPKPASAPAPVAAPALAPAAVPAPVPAQPVAPVEQATEEAEEAAVSIPIPALAPSAAIAPSVNSPSTTHGPVFLAGALAPAAPAKPAAAKAPEQVNAPVQALSAALPRPSSADNSGLLAGLSAPPKSRTGKHMMRPGMWQPAVASRFQIVLSEPIDTSKQGVSHGAPIVPSSAMIFDIDLYDNTAEDIAELKRAGKKVICYFSAGTWEKSRPDSDAFPASVKGKPVKRNNYGAYWDELWFDIRNPNPESTTLPPVWDLMRKRIRLAAEKGCDAIDPDNMDPFDPDNAPIGFPITKEDTVNYIKFMSNEAGQYNMSTGLKNAMDILDDVSDHIHFAVNEQCVQSNECGRYRKFLQGDGSQPGKPVFHIEYIDDDSHGPAKKWTGNGGINRAQLDDVATRMAMDNLCVKNTEAELGPKFSTVIKEMELGGWVEFCDGQTATTITRGKDGGESSGGRGSSDDRGDRESSDSSESSESTSSNSFTSGLANLFGQGSSSLSSGLSSLFGGSSSSSTSKPSSSSSSSGLFGWLSPSSSGSTSSSSSSSAAWNPLGALFGGYSGSSGSTSTPSAPSTPKTPSSSSSSSGSGFFGGLSSLFGGGASSSPAQPAATTTTSSSSSSSNPLAWLNPMNWGKGSSSSTSTPSSSGPSKSWWPFG